MFNFIKFFYIKTITRILKELSKRVAISQSNYIPWKGYFDNITFVDEFVLYDDMQYTKRDCRNRNKIKTANGLKWLSVPVDVKGKFHQKIKDTKISDPKWNLNHLEVLKNSYSKAPLYKEVFPFIKDLYCEVENLFTISEINAFFIKSICSFLNIKTKITFSSDYELINGDATEKLVAICKQTNATEYFTSPAAKNYMDDSAFAKERITVNYYDYSGYLEYNQLHGDFEHGVTILDLLFNEGKDSFKFLKFSKL